METNSGMALRLKQRLSIHAAKYNQTYLSLSQYSCIKKKNILSGLKYSIRRTISAVWNNLKSIGRVYGNTSRSGDRHA